MHEILNEYNYKRIKNHSDISKILLLVTSWEKSWEKARLRTTTKASCCNCFSWPHFVTWPDTYVTIYMVQTCRHSRSTRKHLVSFRVNFWIPCASSFAFRPIICTALDNRSINIQGQEQKSGLERKSGSMTKCLESVLINQLFHCRWPLTCLWSGATHRLYWYEKAGAAHHGCRTIMWILRVLDRIWCDKHSSWLRKLYDWY